MRNLKKKHFGGCKIHFFEMKQRRSLCGANYVFEENKVNTEEWHHLPAAYFAPPPPLPSICLSEILKNSHFVNKIASIFSFLSIFFFKRLAISQKIRSDFALITQYM